MPVIVRLRYCVIVMYFHDHNPPHFHVLTRAGDAMVAIASLEVIEGEVDRRAMNEAKDWAEEHRAVLWAKWDEFNP